MMSDGRQEWRSYWTLALAAMLGNSATVLHIYSIGPFMEPLQAEFGWSRAQISVGLTLAAGISAFVGIGIGILIDRWGPRRVGLVGVVLMCSAYALLGTITGSMSNWLFHWALLAIGAASIKPTVWTSAVASRFDASRGLAIAITISGSGLAATVIPIMAAWLIVNFGWRPAFFSMGIGWGLVLFPIIALFFHGAQDKKRAVPGGETLPAGDALTGLTVKQGLRSPAFYKLTIAGGLFAFAVIGLIVHFIPVLKDRGLTTMTAAGIAGIVGIASIAGRLGTGFLLDRFRPDRVATIAFALPVVSALFLLYGDGTLTLSLAAVLVGLSLGSELDVVLYLATRHMGLKRFGVLFALMLIALSAGTSLGPVSAGAVFDNFGSYEYFLWLMIPLVLTGSLLMATLGRVPDYAELEAPRQPEPQPGSDPVTDR